MNEKKILVYGVSEEYYGTIRKLYGEDSTIIDVTGQYQIIFATHADVIIINTDEMDMDEVHSVQEFERETAEPFVEYVYFSMKKIWEHTNLSENANVQEAAECEGKIEADGLNELIEELTVDEFERLFFLYIQLSEMFMIVGVDINGNGQVKYIDCYDETTGKTMLAVLCLEDRDMKKSMVETMNPGYDRYEMASFCRRDKKGLLEFLYEQFEDNLPEKILDLKNHVDEVFGSIYE